MEGFESLKQTNDYDTGIQLEASYDPSTQRIATTTAIFPTRPTDGSGLRLFFVVTEDNVHHTYDELGVSGERSGYDQLNAYAGGTETCYGFEQRPGNIAADDMWFLDVARGTEPASDFSGLRNVFPRALEAETLYSYDHTFPLPTTVDDPQQASVVVMLIDSDGRLLNADRARLTIVSPEAIRVAKKNIQDNHLTGRVSCIQLDAREQPPKFLGRYDMIVSNPPYVTAAQMEMLDKSVKDYEPHLALYGGQDGLDFYRAITRNYTPVLKPGGYICFEFGMGQEADVCHILMEHGYELGKIARDSGERARAGLARKPDREEE